MQRLNKNHRIGIVGSGWISQVHADSFAQIPEATITACYSRTKENAAKFAERNSIAKVHGTIDDLIADRNVDVVSVNTPNYQHAEVAIKAMNAGKHVIVEKPLALTLADADAMIDAAKKNGVILGYAEELVFVPKFVEARRLALAGGIGSVYFVKQMEKHAGPYSPWFFDRKFAGGGILMDMGCHAIEYCRFVLGRPGCTKVAAHAHTYLHQDKTDMDDHIVLHMEFETGQTALVESSWALKGGMDSTAEIYGTDGVIYADLLRGSGIRMYSENGVPGTGAGETRGWSFPTYEWLWENGYPQEMHHFLSCIESGETPLASAKDGRDVLEIMIAGYLSAGTGKTIELPLTKRYDCAPVDLWKNSKNLS
ncbi:MAG: Gfo/Idh/MocA family oxidoreductase [Planctomycetes bacterium]|nr:Gfo/Idh/MocA family oxidoreductase [Planctomycetota bacterium]